MLRVLLAGLHLLALGVGLFAVVYRASAASEPASEDSLRRTFRFDALWGAAAGLWIVTGLWRLLGSIEKPSAYYFSNVLFEGKMALLIAILLLEIAPMLILLRWRSALRRGVAPTAIAVAPLGHRVAIISKIQAALVIIMIFAAAGMSRGFGTHE